MSLIQHIYEKYIRETRTNRLLDQIIRKMPSGCGKIFFIIAGLLLPGFAKLFLVQNLPFVAAFSTYDDLLFIKLADNIASGRWLGDFNHLTLIKGPIYPIWIAFSHKTGIPLFLSQHLLYWAACLVLLYYLRYVLKSRNFIFLVYLGLLFNPASFNPIVMRCAICPALALLIVAFSLSLAFGLNKKFIKQLIPSIFLGVSLSAFWFTREEGIWIVPFLILLFVGSFFRFYWYRNNGHSWYERDAWLMISAKVCLILLPLLILTGAFLSLSKINKHHYDVFGVIELNTKPFKNAYGSLLRIKHDQFRFGVPVSSDAIRKLYGVSPAFEELEPFFEGRMGKSWQMGHMLYSLKQQYEKKEVTPLIQGYIQSIFLEHDKSGIWQDIWKNLSPDNIDINGGGFVWAFREAVHWAGYYSSAEKSRDFYKRLETEIDNACERGMLECHPKRSGMMPPWDNRYLLPLGKIFLYSFYYATGFFDCNVGHEPEKSNATEDLRELYQKVTLERIKCDPKVFGMKRYVVYRSVLQEIWRLYHLMFPWLALLAVVLHVGTIVTNPNTLLHNKILLLASSLLISISSLLFGLSLIHVSSFPGIVTRYLAPIYPLIILYVVLVVYSFKNETCDEINNAK